MYALIKQSARYINRWMAYLYFFFNSLGLKGGLLFTNLLTPFIYLYLLRKKQQPVLYPYFIILLPFEIIHIINGVEWKSFAVSNLLLLSTYIFVFAFHQFLQNNEQMQELFKRILILNFIFVLAACLIYFTPFRELLWYKNKFTKSIDELYRLSLFTFEASYYSLLFTPIAVYYLLKILLSQNQMPAIYLFMLVMIPLLLSLALGVIACLLISFIILYLIHWKKIFYKKKFLNYFLLFVFMLTCLSFLLLVVFPQNPLSIRLFNIYNGVDTSANGRTSDSFGIARQVAGEKSLWFGSGLGQIKILAAEIIRRDYAYWGEIPVIRIPNAMAETFAIFGIAGVLLRLFFILYLFVKTKVLNNYYRTLLFFFIFTYQFTGSYISNIVEYVIWVLAFTNCFPQFDLFKKTVPVTTEKVFELKPKIEER